MKENFYFRLDIFKRSFFQDDITWTKSKMDGDRKQKWTALKSWNQPVLTLAKTKQSFDKKNDIRGR